MIEPDVEPDVERYEDIERHEDLERPVEPETRSRRRSRTPSVAPPSTIDDRDDTEMAAPSGQSSRAGRNLPQAIGIGLLLVGALIASLSFDTRIFLVLLCVAMGVGSWELSRALSLAKIRVTLVPVLLGAVTMNVAAFFRGGEALLLTFGLTVIGIIVWRMADGVRRAFEDIAGSVFVAAYPCFLGGFAALMAAQDAGARRILIFVLVTIASDIGGYATGVLVGRHPMAPSISPKKSWEGLAGSVTVAGLVGAVAGNYLLGLNVAWGLLIGVAAALVATIGDLAESLIKRDLGIKDMGNELPGHGGLMDRLDSLVLTAPLVWLLLNLAMNTT